MFQAYGKCVPGMREELTIGPSWSPAATLLTSSSLESSPPLAVSGVETGPLRTTLTSLRPMKRPRGLWKSQRSSGKPSPTELRPEDGTPDPDGDTDFKQPTKRPKRDGSPEHDVLDVPRGAESATDIEDWDDLKELFNGVIEKYEGVHVFL